MGYDCRGHAATSITTWTRQVSLSNDPPQAGAKLARDRLWWPRPAWHNPPPTKLPRAGEVVVRQGVSSPLWGWHPSCKVHELLGTFKSTIAERMKESGL